MAKYKREISKHYNWLVIIIFLLLSIIGVIYLWHFGYVYNNGDYVYHLARIKAVKNNLITKKFPLLSFGQTIPYGVALTYYPWITLIPFAILDIFIHNPVNLFYTIVMLTTFITYIISYYSAHVINHRWINDFIFAIFYTNSSVIFNFSFREGDIGAILAAAFLPLALFGLINLIKHNRGWFMLTMGLVLSITSHILTGLFATIALIIIALLNINHFKIVSILKAFVGMVIAIIGTAIFWFPDFILLEKNPIVTPLVPNHIASGILTSIGNPNNFIYSLIDLIGVISILLIHKYKFNWLDFTTWLVGVFCILINTHFIANNLEKIFPWILHIQMTYRFSLISHLLLTYLAWKLLTNQYTEYNHNFFLFFITIFILFTPIVDEYNYHFLMNNRPVMTPQLNHKMQQINTKAKEKKITKEEQKRIMGLDSQYKMNNLSYYEFRHYFYSYDYSPNKNVELTQSYDETYYAQIYDQKNKWKGIKNYYPTNKSIIFNHHHEANIQLPIVLYNGIKYQFTINGHLLNKNNINYQLSYQKSELVLKNLPKGKIEISLKDANINNLKKMVF